MKIFVSWSKPLSQSIAESFGAWVPKVIQECRDPYVSSDTDKGEAWFQTITTQLRESKVGIVFITPQNVREEWIHLESGAIYAALDKRLCPILVGLKKTDYDGPLRNIQMTELDDKPDMLKLMKTLNKNCDTPLDDAVLEDSFDRWWPDLETAVAQAFADNPETAPVSTRSEAEKIDEILLMVRNLNVRVSGAGESAPDGDSKRDAKSISNDRRLREERDEQDMAEFIATQRGKFVLENGEVIGRVVRVRKRGDDFRVQVRSLRNSDSEDSPASWVASASELELSEVPF
ncbi:TIR domain-containing protein [Salinibacterium sp. SWN167]|uniref:TIR domain-containing protein n=1 Tax=Salinibacterium sp. SWN167 TaxID=2792054 RepID=UPI0018CE2B84|nr:TIR domain-containing protein [Salinibacterium sp. SWN167]MBH0083846.1 toll/interleukin-1 receptor domain-containing protein [Salinibacterium sp. SWN167]